MAPSQGGRALRSFPAVVAGRPPHAAATIQMEQISARCQPSRGLPAAHEQAAGPVDKWADRLAGTYYVDVHFDPMRDNTPLVRVSYELLGGVGGGSCERFTLRRAVDWSSDSPRLGANAVITRRHC
jgi:hypothetical protein